MIQDDDEEGQQNMSTFSQEMGSSLHLLLQNIHKLPTPPPVNNPHNPDIEPKQYREVLVNYLMKIKDVNEFVGTEQVFLPVNDNIAISSSSKTSLGFIMNQPEREDSMITIENLPKVRYK